jgi:hypothetical protein
MAAGMVAATLTNTPDALAIAPKAAELAWPTPGLLNTGLMLLAAAVAAYAGLIKAAQTVSIIILWRCPPKIMMGPSDSAVCPRANLATP